MPSRPPHTAAAIGAPLLAPSTIDRVKSSYGELAERRKARVVEALPVPEQTIETLKEDKEWLKNPTLSART